MLIHIGMHKCASTSLQKLIGRSKERGLVQFYDAKYQDIEKVFTRYFASNIEDPEDISLLKNFFLDKKILSSEGLCGQQLDIYSGFYLNSYPKKLLKIVPQIDQIILILRDPIELLFSMYKNDVQMGIQLSKNEWITTLKKRNWTTLINPKLIYDHYSDICKDIRVYNFKNIVKMSPTEIDKIVFNGLLKIDPKIKTLVKANSGQSFFSINIQRIFINQLFKTKHSKLHHIGRANAPIYNFYRYQFSRLVDIFSFELYEKKSFKDFSNIIENNMSEELANFNKFMAEHTLSA